MCRHSPWARQTIALGMALLNSDLDIHQRRAQQASIRYSCVSTWSGSLHGNTGTKEGAEVKQGFGGIIPFESGSLSSANKRKLCWTHVPWAGGPQLTYALCCGLWPKWPDPGRAHFQDKWVHRHAVPLDMMIPGARFCSVCLLTANVRQYPDHRRVSKDQAGGWAWFSAHYSVTQANPIFHHLPPMLFPWGSSCGQRRVNLENKYHPGPLCSRHPEARGWTAYVAF